MERDNVKNKAIYFLINLYMIVSIATIGGSIFAYSWNVYMAYNNPNYEVLFKINELGEANLEYALILFTLPGMAYALYRMLKLQFENTVGDLA